MLQNTNHQTSASVLMEVWYIDSWCNVWRYLKFRTWQLWPENEKSVRGSALSSLDKLYICMCRVVREQNDGLLHPFTCRIYSVHFITKRYKSAPREIYICVSKRVLPVCHKAFKYSSYWSRYLHMCSFNTYCVVYDIVPDWLSLPNWHNSICGVNQIAAITTNKQNIPLLFA